MDIDESPRAAAAPTERERPPADVPPAKRSHLSNGQENVSAGTGAGGSGNGSTITSTSTGTMRDPQAAFGSAGVRTKSYQEDAAVAPELRSRLESIGMRTRFNVNRGYGSPPPSQQVASVGMGMLINSGNGYGTSSPSGSGGAGHAFVTDNEVLRNVRSTQHAWGRTRSVPLHALELQPFGGSSTRPELIWSALPEGADENTAPASFGAAANDVQAGGVAASEAALGELDEGGIGMGDLKRGRDAFLEDWAADEAGSIGSSSGNAAPMSDKPVRGLPLHRGGVAAASAPFGSLRASNVRRAGGSPNGMLSAMTMPAGGSGLADYLASAQPDGMAGGHSSTDDAWRQHDFSAFTRAEDF